MSYQVGQLSYSLFPAVATPGELADNGVNRIVSRVATQAVNPGRALELASDGGVQEPQQTGSTCSVYGFSVFLSAREGVGNNNDTANATGAKYAIGDMVPVLRRGAMFAEWTANGGTGPQVDDGIPNVLHSSDASTGAAANRGKLTKAATSVVTGAEIATGPSWVKMRGVLPVAGSICLIEVNAPGAT